MMARKNDPKEKINMKITIEGIERKKAGKIVGYLSRFNKEAYIKIEEKK